MTKLAYERPVMRAEAFATNAYCDNCTKLLTWTGNLIAWLRDLGENSTKYIFSNESYQLMNNQVSGRQQYYYTGSSEDENDNNVYFLEYSVNGNDFFLYEDLNESGVYQGRKWQSGKGTLQVADSGKGDFGWEASWATGVWYADYNHGNLDFKQETHYEMS